MNKAELNAKVGHHINAVEEWIQEAAEDQGLHGDEVAWDIISSYIAAQIDGGENSAEAKELRRRMLGPS